MSPEINSKMAVFPSTSSIDGNGHLHVGGCDTVELASIYGTPLYVFDEDSLRSKCREFKKEFTALYPDTLVTYASKACTNRALAQIMKEEGLGLDVVSGGELYIAGSVDFPAERIFFHGNNKSEKELREALSYGIGRIMVDNFHELALLDNIAAETGVLQDIMLRIAPGVDAHTHRHTTTGILDSKFGFPLATGQAEQAVAKACSATHLNLVGLHFHLGSPVAETSPYEIAIGIVLKFARDMEQKYGFTLKEFVPGGGFAAQYTVKEPALPPAAYAAAITSCLKQKTAELGLSSPRLIIEPGRAIIARTAVALYTIGSIKTIPDVRTYVCVDGGMGDNIRPALYDSAYEALIANKANEPEQTTVTVAGKYCESGDILVHHTSLAAAAAGDTLAIPVNGAYAIPMASNYNMVTRPAVIMVKDGRHRLIHRRETYEDMVRLDIV